MSLLITGRFDKGGEGLNIMSISQKLRFEVFKRDGFKCAYCGKGPPEVILEADHIDPKSKGGGDDINNLITSCFDCNRGKCATPLTQIPQQLHDNLKIVREREDQYREYRKFTHKIELRQRRDVNEIAAIFEGQFVGQTLNDRFRETSLKMFMRKIPHEDLKEAMWKAVSKIPWDSEKAGKYFCGICWRTIKGTNNGSD